uniref:Putative secreted protein n=1 Tax=Anopheles marajoara TaxID=58244 RepID=A0A2M4C962_9DIPT
MLSRPVLAGLSAFIFTRFFCSPCSVCEFQYFPMPHASESLLSQMGCARQSARLGSGVTVSGSCLCLVTGDRRSRAFTRTLSQAKPPTVRVGAAHK